MRSKRYYTIRDVGTSTHHKLWEGVVLDGFDFSTKLLRTQNFNGAHQIYCCVLTNGYVMSPAKFVFERTVVLFYEFLWSQLH